MSIDDSYIIYSYRYLRLGLLVVTLTLGISLGLEIKWSSCLQGSISAYYYTPVHAIFIGVLFATGFSLIALRGRDLVEDLFFNLAGFLAPVVALVPTSRPNDLCGPPSGLSPCQTTTTTSSATTCWPSFSDPPLRSSSPR